MDSRIAIVNRSEPARRLIHAARELNHERGWSIRTIALHTDDERRATFVREADEAVLIGTPGGGNPYLDHAELERALRESGATAAWVGWGFVAEDPAFAELCERLGVTFIGPPAAVMRGLGDKIAAKLLAEEVGVPVAPWSRGPVEATDEALRHAREIGHPLMIKAAAGGGGRGIRIVTSEEELLPALERAREEGLRAFGDATVLMERLVAGARHVEVQVIADNHGGGWALGVRDCSVQRRSQKLIEESSSPALDRDQDRALRRSALDLVLAAGYRNAGTVEFLYQPQERSFAFLEVNTRLQVEHPVTEMATGVDLVKLQLHVAADGRLDGEPPEERGHAIEARLNAEDPDRSFAPAPGTVELLSLPTGPGIRVDTGIAEGERIPPEYDSMIAKVIAWGADRGEARARLRRALEEMAVVVRGGATNRSFLIDLLDRPEIADGTADTGWLDRLGAESRLTSNENADVALIAAAIDSSDTEEGVERERFYATARRGRPKASHEVPRTVELRHRGESYRLAVARAGPRRYRVTVPEGRIDVEVERLGRFSSRLRMRGRIHRVVSVFHAPDHLVEVNGVAHRVSLDEGGLIRAPAPALVVALPVAAGDEVEAGAPVAVLESMKMETIVTAPFDGAVSEVVVAGNVQVDAGAPLLRMEARTDGAADASDGSRVGFEPPPADAAQDPRDRAQEVLASIRSLLLGFDVSEREARALVAELEQVRSALDPDDPALLRGELEALGVFTDVAELSRDRPPADAEGLEEHVHSAREHFHHYLRSLDAEREGVPEPLRRSLARALGHYGVHDMERSRELAEAAYRIFLAQERVPSQFPAVAGLLDGRLRDAATLPRPLRKELRETLDRLVAATQIRHPAIGELARGVRFAAFDGPLIAAARERVYRDVRQQLDRLAERPEAPDYDDRIEAVVASPQALIPLLGERLAEGIPDHEPLLEILTRRHYKIRDLRDVQRVRRDGRQLVTALYDRRDERVVRLVTTLAERPDLAGAVAAAAEVARDADGADSAVVDVYLTWREPPDGDAMAAELAEGLAAASLPPVVRRVAVSVSGIGSPAEQHFTFRPGEAGFAEERVVRGLHPMIARRLRLWRLDNFDLSRLQSVEDTYLFHSVAREVPADERFVALAEVRDLTPVRDADGTLTALPEIEHKLAGCLEGIRRAQGERPQRRRLHHNHVFLYVWPAVDLPLRELTAVARRLAPMTEGLGLEEVLLCFTAAEGANGGGRETALRFSHQPGAGVTAAQTDVSGEPLAPMDDYAQRVLAARRRGTVYPYELAGLLAGPEGSFIEHDLDEDGRLVPVERPPGGNRAGIVAGLVHTPTEKHPDGIVRVALLGDPTRSLGSVSEPECRRIMAAIDLAEEKGIPVEWFAISSGAKISRDSGTENMDWVARALRRLITFTQAGGEVNVVVAGINVGAQPYWNAEATMLMHTRGILVMTPDSAMVLTGKQALDYSGGVSAEDNFGIGGFDRIMGPNGQAQYWAPHLAGACELLFAYYEHSYVAPGERHPRRAATADPIDRDVRTYPHLAPGTDFREVGDIFASETNPERKKPFDARTLMRAVIDQDREPLERWAAMADADTAVVFDAHLGGYPVTLLGIESRPIPRHQFLPADGPDQWTAGTLFPLSSTKVARAINAASGNRPVVVLANLSGFDGSPESLRKRQLEYGAEIGRAVVNFDGPIIFCVVSRYHGGAFVVFSGALNEGMEVLAVEGSYASVIGGAPAAAVVFAGDVNARTDADSRVTALEERLAAAPDGERARLRAELNDVRAAVRSEKLGEVAAEFDAIHSIERAQRVGSVDEIIPAGRLRPLLVAAIERGLARSLSVSTAPS
jgi:acetyl/propionyl-CoA carboxylase alpha subunit/acetyl-CoA carboxylase carboxyltransferase component